MVGRKRVLKFEKQLELQIDKASNGLEAFSMFKEYLLSSQCQFLCPLSSYRLIIMDLNMPVMDGFVASEKILRCFKENITHAEKNECNIVALTSYTDQDNIQRCLDIGMKEVVHKPIKSCDLKRITLMYLHGLTKDQYMDYMREEQRQK